MSIAKEVPKKDVLEFIESFKTFINNFDNIPAKHALKLITTFDGIVVDLNKANEPPKQRVPKQIIRKTK